MSQPEKHQYPLVAAVLTTVAAIVIHRLLYQLRLPKFLDQYIKDFPLYDLVYGGEGQDRIWDSSIVLLRKGENTVFYVY